MWAALHKRRLSSSQIILYGFALVILAGALVLMLPVSSRAGYALPGLPVYLHFSGLCYRPDRA